jgi:protein subunit release factor A
MWDKLDALERRFTELDALMSRPELFSKAAEYQRYARERAKRQYHRFCRSGDAPAYRDRGYPVHCP